jgi:hypothetical protein
LPFLKVKKYHWHIWNTSLAYDNCLDNLSICNKQLSGQYWQKQNKNIQSWSSKIKMMHYFLLYTHASLIAYS